MRPLLNNCPIHELDQDHSFTPSGLNKPGGWGVDNSQLWGEVRTLLKNLKTYWPFLLIENYFTHNNP